MYGVVLCPRCRRAQGVRLQAKTATCQCGKRLHIPRLRVVARVEAASELPAALGRVRAQMANRLEEFEDVMLSGGLEAAKPAGPKPEPRERVLEALRSISADRGFLVSEAEALLDSMGFPGSRVLEALIREGLLYEVREGRYRVV